MNDTIGIEASSAYDREFSFNRITMAQRRLVWRYLDPLLSTPGMEVLELNCGTGIDAVHMARKGQRVTATDISEEMLRSALETARQNGAEDRIVHRRVGFDDLGAMGWQGRFQFVLSNMGGLNYMDEAGLRRLCDAVA